MAREALDDVGRISSLSTSVYPSDDHMCVSVSYDDCFWAIEQGNCGSITPGVLRSFLPPVQNVHSLSLGLSYSLTDEDVFTFLGQLPHLESLDLTYYLVGLCIPCSPWTTDQLG